MPKHPSAAQQETYFKVLRAIHTKPTLSQRELAKQNEQEHEMLQFEVKELKREYADKL